MHVVLAWFAERSGAVHEVARGLQRFNAAVAPLVPESYQRHDLGGDDWGIVVLHPSKEGSSWRWEVFAEEAGVTAVSLGVPVGAHHRDGPVALAARLLRGDDVHADVVPPFALMALDEGRMAVQQDWLGMCRIFSAESRGVTAFSSRPSLLAQFLNDNVSPDHDGWSSFVVCGHFGGDSSPMQGVRMLRPGERMTGRRREPGGWEIQSLARFSADDLVTRGIQIRERGVEGAIDIAARGWIEAATSVRTLYSGPITLGLSGGKDSRLIAASFIAAGQTLEFNTNVDEPTEGEIATRLLDIVRETRGLEAEHRLVRAGAPAVVQNMGLGERISRLQTLYDHQFPSTFVVRWPGPDRLPDAERPLSLTGAGGELAVGYWYPKTADGDSRLIAEDAAISALLSAVDRSAVVDRVFEVERDRIIDLLDHGETLGLHGLELVDYVYLMERCRRWYTSAYFVGMVTPFLSPGFVAASFALSPQQKRDRLLHMRLLESLLPEWADVPYFSGRTARSKAARTWDGDGLEVIHALLDTTHGDLVDLLRRDAVATALAKSAGARGTVRDERTLQQFAYVAAASQRLEPHGVHPRSECLGQFLAAHDSSVPVEDGNADESKTAMVKPSIPPRVSSIARHLQFLKATRLGHRAWTATRTRLIRARHPHLTRRR